MAKKTIREKIDNQLVILLIYMIVVITIVSSLLGLLNKQDKTLFGYTARIVVSGSMEPEIMTNSLTIIKSCDIEDLNKGDVVCYRYSKDIIHRVIEKVTDENGVTVLHTKGDANENPDSIEIHDDMILGKVVHTFNGLAPYIEKYSITPGNIDTVSLSKNIVTNFIIVGVLFFIALWILQWAVIFIKALSVNNTNNLSKCVDKYIKDIDELIMYREILTDIRDNETKYTADTKFEFILGRMAQAKAEVEMNEIRADIRKFKADVRRCIFMMKLGKLMDMDNKDSKNLTVLLKDEK